MIVAPKIVVMLYNKHKAIAMPNEKNHLLGGFDGSLAKQA
jgi:hypothetical protein